MRLSVVIPAFNEERFIGLLLTSLRTQTYTKPFEIIVVDNNSTDKTAKIARKYGARVIRERKQGYAHTCNRGFQEAKGIIIARADADHVVPTHWLAKIDEAFQKDKKLIAIGGPIYPLESHWFENLLYFPTQLSWMYILKICGRGFLFPNMAVKKKAFQKCGGFDTTIKFGEDTNLCYKLKKIGKVNLLPSLYAYTSVRRLRAMGIINFMIKYAIINEYAKSDDTMPVAGLEVIRKLPSLPPKQRHPLPYLIFGPAIGISVLLLLSIPILAFKTNALPQTAQKKIQYILASHSTLYTMSKEKLDFTSEITPYLERYNIFNTN